MNQKTESEMLVRVAREKGDDTSAYGDHAFHNVLNQISHLLLVTDGEGQAEAYPAAGKLHAIFMDEFRKAIEVGKGNPVEILGNAFQAANRELQAAVPAPEVEGAVPGLSCLAAFVVRNNLYIAHAGDCRLYLFRDGSQLLKTGDHTEARELVEKLEITAQEASSHPGCHRPIRKVGAKKRLNAEVRQQPISLKEGDRVLLCSDGIHDNLEDRRIARIAAGDNPMTVPDRLAEAAGVTGGDDRTAILLAVGGLTEGATDESSSLAPAARMKEMSPTGTRPRLVPQDDEDTASGAEPADSEETVVSEAPAPEAKLSHTVEETLAPSVEEIVAASGEEQAAPEEASPPPEQDAVGADEVEEPSDGVSADEAEPAPPPPAEEYEEFEEEEEAVGFFERLRGWFVRKKPDLEEYVEEPADFAEEGETEVGDAGPRRRFGKTELILLTAIILLLILAAVYYLPDLFGTSEGGFVLPSKEGAGSSTEEGRAVPDKGPGVQAVPTGGDVGAGVGEGTPEAETGGDSGTSEFGGTGLVAKETCDEGLICADSGMAEKLCKMTGGTDSQCLCYEGCNQRFLKGIGELEGVVWTEDCASLIDKQTPHGAYPACVRTDPDYCNEFKLVRSLWKAQSANVLRICKEKAAAACKSGREAAERTRITDSYSCGTARNEVARVKKACVEAGLSADLGSAESRVESQCAEVMREEREAKSAKCIGRVDLLKMKIDSLKSKLDLAGTHAKKKLICGGHSVESLRVQAEEACQDNLSESTRLGELLSKRKQLCTLGPAPSTSNDCIERCERAARKVVSGASSTSKYSCRSKLKGFDRGGRIYKQCMACPSKSKASDVVARQKQRLRKKCENLRKEPDIFDAGVTIESGGTEVNIPTPEFPLPTPPEEPDDDDLFDD